MGVKGERIRTFRNNLLAHITAWNQCWLLLFTFLPSSFSDTLLLSPRWRAFRIDTPHTRWADQKPSAPLSWSRSYNLWCRISALPCLSAKGESIITDQTPQPTTAPERVYVGYGDSLHPPFNLVSPERNEVWKMLTDFESDISDAEFTPELGDVL